MAELERVATRWRAAWVELVEHASGLSEVVDDRRLSKVDARCIGCAMGCSMLDVMKSMVVKLLLVCRRQESWSLARVCEWMWQDSGGRRDSSGTEAAKQKAHERQCDGSKHLTSIIPMTEQQ